MSVLDTHTIFKTLITRGFTEEQAEGIVYAQEQKIDELVTKGDLDIAIYKLKIDLIKWVTPMFLANTALILGLWFK